MFNRKAVESALRKARALWGRLRQSDYPNGAMIFCSESIAEVAHPLLPLQRRVYSCGRHFDTTVLRAHLETERAPAFGIIVIDGSESCIGSARGIGSAVCDIAKLAQVSSTAGSSTRRGGSSAARYGRLREEADLAFLRRVVERSEVLLHQATGIILAGKADTKQRLFRELTPSLQKRVLCTLDLPCSAGLEGLRLAACRAAHAVATDAQKKNEGALNRFMELLEKPTSESGVIEVCYGRLHTLAALEMGAVETLLVAEGCDEDTWEALAESHATVLVKVPAHSDFGVQFCSSFRVGGCLRWPLDPDLLEGDDEGLDSCASAELRRAMSTPLELASTSGKTSPMEVDALTVASTSGSSFHCTVKEQDATDTSEGRASDEVMSWLRAALIESLGDEASAESLVICVTVLLEDESTDGLEAQAQVREMLLGEQVPLNIIDELAERVQ